jgi:hypothetical protein
MLNSAIGGDFYSVTPSGGSASSINAAAFLNDGNWSLAITSASGSATTVSVSLPATGAAPTQAFELSAATPTTTNESGNNVTISSATIMAPLQVTIPAYGFVILLPAGATL